MHVEPTAAWRELRADLRRAVGESTFEIWLEPLELVALRDGKLLIDAPTATRAWVTKRFGRLLATRARSVFGDNVEVELSSHGVDRPGEPARQAGQEVLDLDAGALNPRYSFEQFIIGDGNRLAHAAALAVAELPGGAYNPLFLHAPPGLGKTHLLHAIGNYVRAFGGGSRVRYTTVEAFTNQFIRALGSRSLDRFKHAYRDTDVLLIDDVQFLASKAKTEEEFFHTFNAVYETGRQLVLTCDRLPRQLLAVEERLRERFESGLVAVIKPPDVATRVAILRKRAALDHIQIDDLTVLELIADRVTDNVRALEGALIRVVAHHSLTQLADRRPPGRGRSGRDPSASRRRARGVNLGRLDPARRRRLLRTHAGATQVRQSSRSHHLAPTSRHPPVPRPHEQLAQRDRPGLRRPQPRHRGQCLQACREACRQRPTGCSRTRRAEGTDPGRAPSRRSRPVGLTDLPVLRTRHLARSMRPIERFSTSSTPL